MCQAKKRGPRSLSYQASGFRQTIVHRERYQSISPMKKAKVREMLQTWRNEGLSTPPSLKGHGADPGQ
jgi:hypothetical protein